MGCSRGGGGGIPKISPFQAIMLTACVCVHVRACVRACVCVCVCCMCAYTLAEVSFDCVLVPCNGLCA